MGKNFDDFVLHILCADDSKKKKKRGDSDFSQKICSIWHGKSYLSGWTTTFWNSLLQD